MKQLPVIGTLTSSMRGRGIKQGIGLIVTLTFAQPVHKLFS